MFQTVLALSVFGTEIICSMGGDFTTEHESLWIARSPSTETGGFASKRKQIVSSFKKYGFNPKPKHLLHAGSTAISKDATFFIRLMIDQELLQSSFSIPDSFKIRCLPIYQPLMRFTFIYLFSSMPKCFNIVDPELDKALSKCERKPTLVERIEHHFIKAYDEASTYTEAGLYPVPEELRSWMRKPVRKRFISTFKTSSSMDDEAWATLEYYLIGTLLKVWHLIGTSNMDKAIETIQQISRRGTAGDIILFAYLSAAAGQAQLFVNPAKARKDFEAAQRYHEVAEHQKLLEIASSLADGNGVPYLDVDESRWPLLAELRERYSN